MSSKPAAARRSSCHSMSAFPPARSKGLGAVSVTAPMRSPLPAASRIALAMPSEAQLRTRLDAVEPVEQLGEWPQLAIAARGLPDVAKEARGVFDVALLAVAMSQPREDAGHLEMA